MLSQNLYMTTNVEFYFIELRCFIILHTDVHVQINVVIRVYTCTCAVASFQDCDTSVIQRINKCIINLSKLITSFNNSWQGKSKSRIWYFSAGIKLLNYIPKSVCCDVDCRMLTSLRTVRLHGLSPMTFALCSASSQSVADDVRFV